MLPSRFRYRVRVGVEAAGSVLFVPRTSSTSVAMWFWETEGCVRSVRFWVSNRVHLIWKVIPFEKNFLSAPIHSTLFGRLIGASFSMAQSSLAVPIGGELKAFRPFFRFTCQYLCSRSACFRCKSAKKRNCNINCVLCDKQRRNDINSGVWCVHLQIGFLTFALEEKIQRD
jgi:hypothetical protein